MALLLQFFSHHDLLSVVTTLAREGAFWAKGRPPKLGGGGKRDVGVAEFQVGGHLPPPPKVYKVTPLVLACGGFGPTRGTRAVAGSGDGRAVPKAGGVVRNVLSDSAQRAT